MSIYSEMPTDTENAVWCRVSSCVSSQLRRLRRRKISRTCYINLTMCIGLTNLAKRTQVQAQLSMHQHTYDVFQSLSLRVPVPLQQVVSVTRPHQV